MKKLSFIIFLLPLQMLAQQEASFPRDTSYTVNSTYKKLLPKYPIIESVQPDLPEGVMQRKDVVYRTLGNRKLHADVFYPDQENDKELPGVLLIHGGGWRSGDKSLMIPLARQLAKRGYVTVCAEYRLSLEAPYPTAVHDLKDALRWMRSSDSGLPLDSDRIAVLGCSAGAQLAALIGTTNGMEKMEGEGSFDEYSSDVQAIISIDGVLAFHHPESEEGAVAAQWLGGTYEEVPEIWTEASALTHVDQNTPPMLFIGSSFPRFHAGKNDVIKVLKANDIHYETYVFDGSPHSFWLFHPWFEPTLDYTVNFLNNVFGQP